MKKISLLIVALIFWITQINSQSFLYESKLSNIHTSGLYKIPLNPKSKQFMTADLHDTRIYDSNKNEIPYIVLSEPLLKPKSDFVEYKIISNKHFSDYSEIIIHNPNNDIINNIAFNVNNSDAYKYCAIEGSDDGKQWYSISAHQELSLIYNNDYTNTYMCIYFPKNKYAFFRLLVDDWDAKPLKINSAGFFKYSIIAGKLNDILFSQKIVTDPVHKTTTIHVSLINKQQINRVDFKIKSPRLFNRRTIVFTNKTRKLNRHKTETYREIIAEFNLNATQALFIDLQDNIIEKEFFIEIENKDNPPLQIESIECKQLASYIICDLDSNKTYTLKTGNYALKLPEYDLNHFISEIPQLLPVATISEFKKTENNLVNTTKKQLSFFEKKEFLWLCLGIGSIILFFFSKNLLKEMKDKK